ncbi:MAG TPA: redoxin domain-containing protein [Saprospiraceae bacterium]|nr:redoxin domain-containing protein [Saprospiraceae bacterium]
MKNSSLLMALPFLTISSVFAQALEIGATVPAFRLELLQEQEDAFTEEDLSGKVTIFEFWATWCSPCVASMKDMVELKKEFDQQLQILAISYEDQARIKRFMSNRPLDLVFAYDHEEQLNSYFPHRTVPHTVIIDQQGRVAAITRPGAATQETIRKLLRGQPIDLPRKNDDLGFDYQSDYFRADTNTLASFVLESAIPEVGTFSKQPNQGPFADRRISMHNFTIDGLYRTAYETSAYRMVYEVDEALFDYDEEKNKYCLDLIVAPGQNDQLHTILREKIHEQFDIQARLEKRKEEVVVLYRPDTLESNLQEADKAMPVRAGGDHFASEGATLGEFADYLESFGIVGKPVVDETDDEQRYAFDFFFEPENPDTFHKAIREMGLKLKKAEREIEVLVIYQGAALAE